jgi:hypothetical protein
MPFGTMMRMRVDFAPALPASTTSKGPTPKATRAGTESQLCAN